MIDTRYMYRPPSLDAETFRRLVGDVQKLVHAAPDGVQIRGVDGFGVPTVMTKAIALNGDAAIGAHCEPLIIERDFTLKPPSRMKGSEFFDFCKTNGKPYDLLVVAVLYAFINRFPTCRFISDSTLAELKPGFDLFFEVCAPSADVQRLYERPVADRQVVA